MLSEHDAHRTDHDLNCVNCGHDWIVTERGGTVTCPNCQMSYSLVVRDEFALVETGGWIADVTFDVPEELRSGLTDR